MYQSAERPRTQQSIDGGSSYKEQLRSQLRDNYVSNRSERKSQASYTSTPSRQSATHYPTDFKPQLQANQRERFGAPTYQARDKHPVDLQRDFNQNAQKNGQPRVQGTKTPSDVRAAQVLQREPVSQQQRRSQQATPAGQSHVKGGRQEAADAK